MYLSNVGTVLKFRHGRNRAFPFAATHEQTFLLPHYSVASAALTTLAVPTATTATTLFPEVGCVDLPCSAEGSHNAAGHLFGPLT